MPGALPFKFVKNRVFATTGLINQERKIPELARWYIADQPLGHTEQLNEVLNGRASSRVEELCNIRGKTRLGWRILKELNRSVLSVPEALAHRAYHVVLDVRLRRRWQHLQAIASLPTPRPFPISA